MTEELKTKIKISMVLEVFMTIFAIVSFIYAPNRLIEFCSLFVAMMSVGFAFYNKAKLELIDDD